MVSGKKNSLVLFADVADEMQPGLAGLLDELGIRYQLSGTGTNVLKLVREMPDLLVLSLDLVDIDSLELCRRLRKDPRTTDLPILLRSKTPPPPDTIASLVNSVADGYLATGASSAELIAWITVLLRKSSSESMARRGLRQWQQVMDALPDGVLLVDSEMRIVSHNRLAPAVLNMRANDLNQLPFAELFPRPDDGQPVTKIIEQTRQRLSVVTESRTLDSRTLHLQCGPLLNRDSGWEGAACVVRDITERQTIETLKVG